MMEERITTLEAASDSNATALAALGNEMNDRFNRIETELSELRQNKADNDSLRGEIQLRFEMLRSAEEKDFKAASDNLSTHTAMIREDIDRRFNELRQELDRRFAEPREETNRRFGLVDDQFKQVEKRFQEVDKRFDEVDKRFDAVDKRFEAVDRRFEQVDKRFDRVEASIDELRKELQRFTRWGLGLLMMIAVAAISVAAKAFLG